MIKYIVNIAVSVFCIIGCTNKKNEHPCLNVDCIDYSYYDGWTECYSLKTNHTGDMYVLEESHGKEKRYGFYKLTGSCLDHVNLLINRIDFTQMDTLYSKDCVDCGCYYLIIRNQKQVNKVFVENIDNNDPEIKSLSKLSKFLNTIVQDSVQYVNDSFFESKINSFRPMPPMPPRGRTQRSTSGGRPY